MAFIDLKFGRLKGADGNGTDLRDFSRNSVILRPKAEESQRLKGWDSSALLGLQNDDNLLKSVPFGADGIFITLLSGNNVNSLLFLCRT